MHCLIFPIGELKCLLFLPPCPAPARLSRPRLTSGRSTPSASRWASMLAVWSPMDARGVPSIAHSSQYSSLVTKINNLQLDNFELKFLLSQLQFDVFIACCRFTPETNSFCSSLSSNIISLLNGSTITIHSENTPQILSLIVS